MAVKGENCRQIGLAIALSGLAGYVDALAYLHLHGYFVAFMSGNSTQLGIALMPRPSRDLAAAAFIIAFFVVGVVAGELAARRSESRQRACVLGFETLCLTAAAGLHVLGASQAAIACMAMAMGAENNAFQRGGQVSLALTYMTGSLVRMGQSIVEALTGGKRLGWLSDLMLWSGMVAGALAGTASYRAMGLAALWIAAGYSCLLAVTALRVR
jgi:uncharacterized membrane protein YoaK (UPF0700 family)